MMESRRAFIGSLAAAGTFGVCRAFAAPVGFCASRKPNLVFGALSDIHISTVGTGGDISGWKDNLTFRHALEWFREQGVDAVVVAGDLTNKGSVEELAAVAEAWNRVFPNDRTPEGRPVSRIFVTGNHDFHGYLYGKWGEKVYPDPAERARHLLRADFGKHWQAVFHEPYERSFHKRIKGYDFFGRQWDDGSAWDCGSDKSDEAYGIGLDECLAAAKIGTNPRRPFFYVQHAHPKDTCFGSWAWGHDSGRVTATLARYPNAIALSGHSHYSLTDERALWQGEFTSFGCGSLRYSEPPYDSVLPVGYENSVSGDHRWAHVHDALKAMPVYASDRSRQGSLWRVYDDCIIVSRRDFLSDSPLGDDWVIPLPSPGARPFNFACRAKAASAPQFAKGASLEVAMTRAVTRETKRHSAEEKDAVEIRIPPALAVSGARPLAFLATVSGAGGKTAEFRVLAEGYDLPLANLRARQTTKLVLTVDRFPSGAKTLAVTPVDCWDKCGRQLTADIRHLTEGRH